MLDRPADFLYAGCHVVAIGPSMHITKRAVEQLVCAKPVGGADYRWDDRLKGFGVRVYPSGRKTFLIAYRNARGVKRFLGLGDFGRLTVDQARRLAQARLADVCRGTDPQAAREKARGEPSFADLATRYLEHVRSYKRSWEDDQQRLRDHILPVLSRRGLSEIGLSDLQILLAQVKDRRSASTANRCGALLKHVLRCAERWGLVERSPARDLALFREPPPRDIMLNPNECRRILEACDADPNPFAGALFKLAMFTGRRLGELLKAKWGDVSLERRLLVLPETKAGERQFVHLNDAAARVIEGLPRLEGNPYLIVGERPGRALVFYRPAWGRILGRANMAPFPPHGLRHSFASTLVAAGVPLETVGHLLGHKSSVTTRRYAHHRPEHLLSATGRFVSLLEEGVSAT